MKINNLNKKQLIALGLSAAIVATGGISVLSGCSKSAEANPSPSAPIESPKQDEAVTEVDEYELQTKKIEQYLIDNEIPIPKESKYDIVARNTATFLSEKAIAGPAFDEGRYNVYLIAEYAVLKGEELPTFLYEMSPNNADFIKENGYDVANEIIRTKDPKFATENLKKIMKENPGFESYPLNISYSIIAGSFIGTHFSTEYAGVSSSFLEELDEYNQEFKKQGINYGLKANEEKTR